MIHISAGDSTFEALASCLQRLVKNVAIPEGSTIGKITHSSISEVSWLRLRFTDGSELELWPETIATPIDQWPYPFENFVVFAEFRNETLLTPFGDLFRTRQRFVEFPALTVSLAGRQIRNITINSMLDHVEGTTFRIDSTVDMLLDNDIVQFITQGQQVLPMALCVRHIKSSDENAF